MSAVMERTADADAFMALVARNGRNAGPRLLLEHYCTQQVTDYVLSEVVADVWSLAEWPQSVLTRTDWIDLFRRGGYTDDGERAEPPSQMTLYRGCLPSYTRGMAWTGDLDVARRFASGDLNGRCLGHVYTTTVESNQILAHITDRNEDEYVIDTTSIAVAREVRS